MRSRPHRRGLSVSAVLTLPALGLTAALLLTSCTSASDASGTDADTPAVTADGCAGPRTARSNGWIEPMQGGAEAQLPVTLPDFTGEEVTITDTSRLLALDTYGTLATTVYALGLGDQLVGRDVSTGIPELADLPVVTHNGHELSAEAILELDPSVVLTDYSIGPLEVQLQLKDAGIPVVILDGNRSRAVIGDQIKAVANVLGVPSRGEELASRVAADVAEAEAKVASMLPPADQRIRMVFLYMRGTAGIYYWFGKGSGADDLIDALGGIDVASETGLAGARPVNAEGLVKANPELFLMMSHGLDSVGGVSGLMEVAGVAETPAGAGQCVVDMSDYEILSFGPQFPHTLLSLATAIYGTQNAGT